MALTVLAALAAALAAAASVPLVWWLGVWGYLATLGARVHVLEGKADLAAADVLRRLNVAEAAIEGLRSRLSREDGRAGRAKQVAAKEELERREAELVAAAETDPSGVQQIIASELGKLPPLRGRQRGPRALPPSGPEPDIIPEAGDAQTTA